MQSGLFIQVYTDRDFIVPANIHTPHHLQHLTVLAERCKNKRMNNRTILLVLKNNAAAGYQDPVKIELLKGAGLLSFLVLKPPPHPHTSGNVSLTSYFPLKIVTIEDSLPLRISSVLPWVRHEHFPELHIVY